MRDHLPGKEAAQKNTPTAKNTFSAFFASWGNKKI
jgi:hypothetical protein